MSNLSFTNELKDAVFSLRMVAECLAKVKEESHYLKWVIIALHNTLQGFMVSALCNGNDFPVIESVKAKIIECPACGHKTELQALKNERLIPFGTLYKRIKSPYYMQRVVFGKPFRPSGTQGKSVKKLIVWMRNSFIHFTPKGLFLRPLFYLPVVKDVIDVVSFLALESGNIFFNPEVLRSQTEKLIEEIRVITNELDKYYTAELKKPFLPALDFSDTAP
jgi:hypothetical protein